MTHDDREVLTALLDSSRPPVPPVTLAEQTALTHMATAASSSGMFARARRLPRRLVAGLVAGIAVLGSGTVAAAVSSDVPSLRAQDAVLTCGITPSGDLLCEERLRRSDDDAVADAVPELTPTRELVVVIDAEIAGLRAEVAEGRVLRDSAEASAGSDSPCYTVGVDDANGLRFTVGILGSEQFEADDSSAEDLNDCLEAGW